MQKHTKYP